MTPSTIFSLSHSYVTTLALKAISHSAPYAAARKETENTSRQICGQQTVWIKTRLIIKFRTDAGTCEYKITATYGSASLKQHRQQSR